MEKIYYFAIGLLIFLIILFFGISAYLNNNSKKDNLNNLLIPFSGRLAPSSIWEPNISSNNVGTMTNPEDGLFLVGVDDEGDDKSNSKPQLQCPEGYKLNIVSAYLDIVDPYGSCTNIPDPTLERTCGIDPNDSSTAVSCTDSSVCGPGMSCDNKSKTCIPKSCGSNNECSFTSSNKSITSCNTNLGKCCKTIGDKSKDETLICVKSNIRGSDCDQVWVAIPGAGDCMACINPDNEGLPVEKNESGFCSFMPTCMLINNGLNHTCSPNPDSITDSNEVKSNDINKCRPRDASAYLAKHCNGKSKCLDSRNDMWLPNEKNGPFGPLPCKISAKSNDPTYITLPIISGWGGNSTIPGTSPQKATFSQGYTVHGIAQCLPESYFI